jgi:very-short-patch-repair endonuclease
VDERTAPCSIVGTVSGVSVLDLLAELTRQGGVAGHADLVGAASRRSLERALAEGLVVRDARGRYAFPTADDGRRAANRLRGVATHLSAAAHWGWSTKEPADRPWVTVPRNRVVSAADQKAHHLSWRRLDAVDVVDGWVTGPLRTVLDCASTLPLDAALAVADSSLRSGAVTHDELLRAADLHPARGRQRVAAVARGASAQAANPFESVLRAICLEVAGLEVVPQVEIAVEGFFARVDLADVGLRIVIEADSFEFHGGRDRLRHDCWRYDELVARGWIVLRFAWEQVMFAPDWVRLMLVEAVQRARERALVAGKAPRSGGRQTNAR